MLNHRLFTITIELSIVAFLSSHASHVAAKNYTKLRQEMVATEIEAAGVTHAGVLDAMRATPRHTFVPAKFRKFAYFDNALPIGDKQTISPPFVVAYMTEMLDPQPTDRVLEIGTGSGYQAAVLSPLVAEVYTIEIVERLGRRAKRTLQRLGYDNVHVRIGDGYKGWPEHAPFDKIIVTCSPESVPQPLVDQLKEGGQMIVPVGERYQQNLFRLTKTAVRGRSTREGEGQLKREALRATLFVPMTGRAEDVRQVLPDPAHPRIVNGSFEQVLPDNSRPAAWHYLRQAEVITNAVDAPEGTRFLRFTNQEPGQGCRALQGMAVDGRKVAQLKVSITAQGNNLQRGPTPQQRPGLVLTFYDQRRAVIDSHRIGHWEGTFGWRVQESTIGVPLGAREVIVRIGLLGGVGQFDVDELRLGNQMGLDTRK